MHITENIRIQGLSPLVSPALVHLEYPLTDNASNVVTEARQTIVNMLNGKDRRLLVVVGPCSIHDPAAALEYANKLKTLQSSLGHALCLVMRVYFEKPRTTVGWKGLINDPRLDGSFDINTGLRTARKLLLDINELGLPTGTEFLDTITPQYLSDLISWAAIGARTTESQIHRELCSGLSMPVGFKNGTTGNVKIAVDAVQAAKSPHHFLGVSADGLAAIVHAKGNPDCHVILRGSDQDTNYDASSIEAAAQSLTAAHLNARVMVDCSHGNSRKDHKKQADVIRTLQSQLNAGSDNILGVMIESHLVEGKQTLKDPATLTYGQSITDACIGWDETVALLTDLAKTVEQRI